ncbi:DUF402 domain-containing protein [Tepidiforma sp.]|uniref:DUF402 domain-containing protein n=1 Tax=Tepidiforma sp. TaxID=2682230 RepID=UPI002ADDBBD5|nr:DUF402 domain-containing protein [Tepidiforma sp.]
MPNPVLVRKRKYDRSVRSTWPGDLVDAHDDWLIVLHDSQHHPKDPPDPASAPGYGIHTIGLREPLTVLHCFDALGHFIEAKCDAALPATISGRTIDFVDLDLDVVLLPEGTHHIRDREIFEQRARTMAYPPEVRRAAWCGILHALRRIRRRRFPFDGTPETILGRELASRGPL